MSPFISVIIPSFNGSKTIPFTILNVLGQDYPKERFELIICDDGSSDATHSVIDEIWWEFCNRDNFSIYQNRKKGAASARNLAIKESRGEIIVMLDQDVFVSRNFLTEVEKAMKDVDGIYGRMITDFKNFVEPLNSTTINAKYLTANCAYRKDALLDVGCFSEEFPFHRGDSELAYKLIEKGYRIEYAENVVAYHPLRRFKLSDFARTMKMVQIDNLLFKKHPDLASDDILRQAIPRISLEGNIVVTFILMLAISSMWGVGVYALFTLLGIAFTVLSLKRSSFKGKPWSQRLLASAITMLMLVPMFVGRVIGSVKYRKLLI